MSNLTTTKYGIIGGFRGDDELLRRIKECETLYLGDCDEISQSSLEPLIDLLGDLHFQARLAVALNIIAPSPSRDRIMEELYDYSFEPSDDETRDDDVAPVDEDFVWLSLSDYSQNDSSQDPRNGAPPPLPRALNGNRYHIFSIIPSLVRLSPSCGVHLGERYLKSASTRFQNEIVTSLMHLKGFGNEKVIDTYLHSASGVLCKKILDLCKCIKFRQPVLEALIDRKSIDYDTYGRYCSTPFVRSSLESIGGVLAPRCPKLRNWRAHGTSLYLDLFRTAMEKYQHDLLCCGSVWMKMCALVVPADLAEEHVVVMVKLLEDFRPCQLDSRYSMPFNVKEHLTELSASGKDVLLFESVRRITISDAFLSSLPKRVRLAMTSDALAANDFQRFEQLRRVVSVKRILPLRETSSNATSEQLWGLLLNGSTLDPFLDYCCKSGMGEILESNELALSIDALNGWTAWHLLSLPTPTLVGAKSSSDSWGLWVSSFLRPFEYSNEAFSRLKAAVERDRPLEFSQMTVYARYVHELINIYAPGLELAQKSNEIPVREMIKYYGLVLEPLYGRISVPGAAPQVLANLAAAMDIMVESKMLPLLELHFDPSNKGDYATKTKLDDFQRWMARFITSTNPIVQKKCTLALKNTIAEASLNSRHIDPPNGRNFVEVKDASGKVEFRYFDSSLHRSAIQVCINLLKVQMENYPAVQAEAFPLVKEHCFEAKSIWRNEDYDEYLRIMCTVLTPSLRSGIEANIVSHAFDYWSSRIQYCSKRSIHSIRTALQYLSSAGLFERLVNLLPQSADRDLVRVEMGDFRTDHVRSLLQKNMSGRDGDERVHYYIMWIERAVKTYDPEAIATALDFLSAKVKNEAGMNRSTVYHNLVKNTETFVKATLSNPDVGAVTSIAKSVRALLRNDLDRRDSVAHRVLHRVPFIVMSSVLQLFPEQLLSDVRSTWISLAVDMAWQLAKATGGNDSLLLLELPIHNDIGPLPSSNWIDVNTFDSMFPHRECPQQLSWLRQHFNIKENVKDVDDFSDAFGPSQFVGMIDRALTSVWDRGLPGEPLRMSSSQFPSDEKAAKGLMNRLNALCKTCGVVWEESPLLSGIFDEVFGPDFLQSSKHHFSYACQLLETIMSINTDASIKIICNSSGSGNVGRGKVGTDRLAWSTSHSNVYAIQRVSKACDAVFRYAVAHNLGRSARKWYYVWFEMNKHKGNGDWNLAVCHTRALPFIVRYVDYDGHFFPQKFLRNYGQDETHVLCRTLQKVIEMSPSIVCFEPVRELLLVNRPDVVCTLLCNRELDVKGVFRLDDAKSFDTLLYECITPTLLHRIPFYGAREYARIALKYSSDTSMGMTSRTRAMEMLMWCPSTQHIDVLRILQDDIKQPILEALILRVFLLDAPWHVLGSLLSAEGLTKRNQSMVASLLSHVTKHVYVDKAVSALGLLLDSSRRQVVKVSLHKAIIAMLFQAKTERSVEILQEEWGSATLHGDVRYAMIKLSLQSVASEENGVEWEWSLIDDLGARTDLDGETAVLLLSLVADRGTINKFSPPETRLATSEDEGIRLARGALAVALRKTDDSSHRQKRFKSLMARLEQNLSQPGLGKLAGIKKLMFSRMFVDGQVDVEVMQELTQHISSDIGTVIKSEDDAWIDTLGHMYGDGLYQCTAALLSQKNDGDLRVLKSEKWKEACASLPVAVGAQSFVRSLIHDLMTGEEEQQVRRKQLLTALNGIAEAGDDAFIGIRDEKMHKELTALRTNAEFELKVATQCLNRKR